MFKGEKAKLETPFLPLSSSVILSNLKGCRQIYDRIMSSKYKSRLDTNKWTEDLNIDFNPVSLYIIPFKCCRDKTLQWFQCRILYRILGTNNLLEKMKIKNCNLCSFCKRHPETLMHLFWECEYVIPFWTTLNSYMKIYSTGTTQWQTVDIILGNHNFDNILNTILIIAKSYIFKQRTSGRYPNINDLKKYIKTYYEIEKNIETKNMNLDKFERKWTPYNRLVEDLFI